MITLLNKWVIVFVPPDVYRNVEIRCVTVIQMKLRQYTSDKCKIKQKKTSQTAFRFRNISVADRSDRAV